MVWEANQRVLFKCTLDMPLRERSLFAKLQIAEIIVVNAHNHGEKISSEIRNLKNHMSNPTSSNSKYHYLNSLLLDCHDAAGYPYPKNLNISEKIYRGWIDELDVPSINSINFSGFISELPIHYLVTLSRAGVLNSIPLTKQAMRKFIHSDAFKKIGAVKFDRKKLDNLISRIKTDTYLYPKAIEINKARNPTRFPYFLCNVKHLSAR